MFFYNQRAMFLGFGFLYLSVLTSLAWRFRAEPNGETVMNTVVVLAAFWVLAVLLTLLLHRSFLRRIDSWAAAPATYRYSAVFNRYFLIDSSLVLILIAVGKWKTLNLDAFVSLLLANSVVYSSAYVGGKTGGKRQIVYILLAQIIITCLLFGTNIEVKEPRLFYLFLSLGTFVGMALMTGLSVLMISWLRSIDHETSELRLRLLGLFQRTLSERGSDLQLAGDSQVSEYSERQFRSQAEQVLASLCLKTHPFWYRSACLWFFEEHQDRGYVLVPGANVAFPEAAKFRRGLESPDDLLLTEEILVLHSLRHHTERSPTIKPLFRASLDAPAAFVPLVRDGRRIGVLTLYGEEYGPPVLSEEHTFLWSLASIVESTMEQWEGRRRAFPQKEIDQLFACASLEEMFPKAARSLMKHLDASGCMVIFRPDPQRTEMEVRAVIGLSPSIVQKDVYAVGVGQTGRCAETGEPIKWDDVQLHREEFDKKRLGILQKALGREVVSWMAIPIGSQEQNFGVIKVVNSLARSPWFSEYDQDLGMNLAKRLQIMIEKFLHIKAIEEQLTKIEKVTEDAKLNATNAMSAQARAEKVARERQDDLMIITHQLQAPLSAVISAVTLIRREDSDERLGYIQAFVEDALALCFGTFTTFGREAGKETAFGVTTIDAPVALRKLAARLQTTNARDDIRFIYNEEPGFPKLRMDWRVFTSVFFSLIHNAMKYADKRSFVTLECSFERTVGKSALKLKSVGEPILPREKDLIFEKYERGSVIKKTGRHHSGVGLGLWVARELMRAIGGELTLELSPEHPKLSVFVVTIPSPRE